MSGWAKAAEQLDGPLWAGTGQLNNRVFDHYLAHCEARLRRNDMAAATVRSYAD